MKNFVTSSIVVTIAIAALFTIWLMAYCVVEYNVKQVYTCNQKGGVLLQVDRREICVDKGMIKQLKGENR